MAMRSDEEWLLKAGDTQMHMAVWGSGEEFNFRIQALLHGAERMRTGPATDLSSPSKAAHLAAGRAVFPSVELTLPVTFSSCCSHHGGAVM